MFGAEYRKGRMVTGVSLSHSRGLGSYAGADSGQVTSAVTCLSPWIGFKPSERVQSGRWPDTALLASAGGSRLDTEVGYGLPIGRRFVGTPQVGVQTSEYGRG